MREYSELKEVMDFNPDLFDGLNPKLIIKFKVWIPDNVHIYNEFVKETLKTPIQEGRKRYSAGRIWQGLRWDTLLTENGIQSLDFKVNNNYCPYIAWLSMELEPELKGMFTKRRNPIYLKRNENETRESL